MMRMSQEAKSSRRKMKWNEKSDDARAGLDCSTTTTTTRKMRGIEAGRPEEEDLRKRESRRDESKKPEESGEDTRRKARGKKHRTAA